MIIAVDFDGTIVEHRYPEIGKEIPFAVATLCQLQRDMPGLHIVLWTVREGLLLEDAVEWCEKRGLRFYAVNSNYPGEISSAADQGCRKVSADIYIDDRNLGGLRHGRRYIKRCQDESKAILSEIKWIHHLSAVFSAVGEPNEKWIQTIEDIPVA